MFQAVGMKRDLEAQVNELQSDLSREQTEVSRLRDHNSQLRNQLSDKENKQVKVCTVPVVFLNLYLCISKYTVLVKMVN